MDNFDDNENYNEIAKIYAESDIEESRRNWAINQANLFYKDFADLTVEEIISDLNNLIMDGTIHKKDLIELLVNMIKVYESTEQFERCSKILKIKQQILC